MKNGMEKLENLNKWAESMPKKYWDNLKAKSPNDIEKEPILTEIGSFKTIDDLDLDIYQDQNGDIKFDLYMCQEFWLSKEQASALVSAINKSL